MTCNIDKYFKLLIFYGTQNYIYQQITTLYIVGNHAVVIKNLINQYAKNCNFFVNIHKYMLRNHFSYIPLH